MTRSHYKECSIRCRGNSTHQPQTLYSKETVQFPCAFAPLLLCVKKSPSLSSPFRVIRVIRGET